MSEYLNEFGDVEVDDDGLLVVDNTIETRCRIRLSTKRGEWFADGSLGSRLHEIQYIKNPQRQVTDYIREALQPLIDSNEIISVEVTNFTVDHFYGTIACELTVIKPNGEPLDIGAIDFSINRVPQSVLL